MKDNISKRNKREIKRLADIFLKKKKVRLGSISYILRTIKEFEKVFLKIIYKHKREFRFLSNIYIGILKDSNDRYYLYYRCPYSKKIIVKYEVMNNNDNIYTLYLKNPIKNEREKIC